MLRHRLAAGLSLLAFGLVGATAWRVAVIRRAAAVPVVVLDVDTVSVIVTRRADGVFVEQIDEGERAALGDRGLPFGDGLVLRRATTTRPTEILRREMSAFRGFRRIDFGGDPTGKPRDRVLLPTPGPAFYLAPEGDSFGAADISAVLVAERDGITLDGRPLREGDRQPIRADSRVQVDGLTLRVRFARGEVADPVYEHDRVAGYKERETTSLIVAVEEPGPPGALEVVRDDVVLAVLPEVPALRLAGRRDRLGPLGGAMPDRAGDDELGAVFEAGLGAGWIDPDAGLFEPPEGIAPRAVLASADETLRRWARARWPLGLRPGDGYEPGEILCDGSPLRWDREAEAWLPSRLPASPARVECVLRLGRGDPSIRVASPAEATVGDRVFGAVPDGGRWTSIAVLGSPGDVVRLTLHARPADAKSPDRGPIRFVRDAAGPRALDPSVGLRRARSPVARREVVARSPSERAPAFLVEAGPGRGLVWRVAARSGSKAASALLLPTQAGVLATGTGATLQCDDEGVAWVDRAGRRAALAPLPGGEVHASTLIGWRGRWYRAEAAMVGAGTPHIAVDADPMGLRVGGATAWSVSGHRLGPGDRLDPGARVVAGVHRLRLLDGRRRGKPPAWAPDLPATSSLDPDLQATAELELARTLAAAPPSSDPMPLRGALLVMDARHGDVLACATATSGEAASCWQDFDLRPGSAWKIATTAAALTSPDPAVVAMLTGDPPAGYRRIRASGRLDDARLPTRGGREIALSTRLRNFHGRPTPLDATLDDALADSSNTYFGYLGLLLDGALRGGAGDAAFADAAAREAALPLAAIAARAGFDADIEIGGSQQAHAGRFPATAPESDAPRAAAAIGQDGVRASPLGLAILVGLAADGAAVMPRLDPLMPVRRDVLLRPDATARLRRALSAVVLRGTARAAFAGNPYRSQVVGKTGSAERIDGDGVPRTDGWFAGLLLPPDGQADAPVALVAVLPDGGLGGHAPASLIDAMVREVAAARGWQPAGEALARR